MIIFNRFRKIEKKSKNQEISVGIQHLFN